MPGVERFHIELRQSGPHQIEADELPAFDEAPGAEAGPTESERDPSSAIAWGAA